MTRPLLIFDGKCGFCRLWIDYWKQLTRDRVDYAPSQEVRDQFPQIPREAFSKSVQFIRADGSVAQGARAVFETLAWERWYERVPLLAPVSEAAYRWIAAHRDFAYWFTRLTFGRHIQVAAFAHTQWLFLRLLAVVYAIAFASVGVQASGLIGSQGIAPAGLFMRGAADVLGESWWARVVSLPTLFWLSADDRVLVGACWLGFALAVALLVGRLERLLLVSLYALYLSLALVGQPFLLFQWDSLLLEAGFLAIFFAQSRRGLLVMAWLYRALVFRLFFLSGWVKLASGDPAWRALTALDYHFWTQPLPNVVSWYVAKLPEAVLRGATGVTLVIELGAPFLTFAPRLWRLTGAWMMLGLQALIFVTGNYTFFNLLTAALVVWCFDDQALRTWMSRRWASRWRRWGRASNTGEGAAEFASREAAAAKVAPNLAAANAVAPNPVTESRIAVRRGARWVVAVLIGGLGLATLWRQVTLDVPGPVEAALQVTAPFQIVNPYGLFAVMTTSRPEIVLEGSRDGEQWEAYEFRYKPGDVTRSPAWVAPHQPRVDWQMWFAALGSPAENVWLLRLGERMLAGEAEAVGVFGRDPFAGAEPPEWVRARLYEYRFTSLEERSRTGAWWRRELVGEYFPAMGRRGGSVQ